MTLRKINWSLFGEHDVIFLVFVICSYDEWKTKHNLIPESHDERSNSKHDRYYTNMLTSTRPILYRCGICLTILFFSIYLTILNLPRGEHYYRYIVDGKGMDTLTSYAPKTDQIIKCVGCIVSQKRNHKSKRKNCKR